MLVNLHVKNLALIEEESIDFEEGLNILSGETGAGKSIILGSINAALGAKTSPDFIRTGCEYGLAEILFHISDPYIQEQISKLGVLYMDDEELLISRKIMPGRSQIKVNGQNFTAAQTRALAHLLIDIHGQHDNQLLMDESSHIDVIDLYGESEIAALKEELGKCYKEFALCKKNLEEMSGDEESKRREISFLEYEIHEIESANLTAGEDETLENDYRKMCNYQKIISELSNADKTLNSGNNNCSDMIGSALKSLIAASEYDDALSSACDILSDVESLIGDAGHMIRSYMDESSYDPERFARVEARLDLLNHLKSKYGNSIDSILEELEAKKSKLDEYNHFDAVKLERQKAYDKAFENVKKLSAKLSKLRKKTAEALSKEIIQSLKELNFLDVRFFVKITERKNYTSNGNDDVCFLISTNPGEDLKPLSKIASGGELSRIMLAVKSVMAQKDANTTFIFDEIDAGISGKTAQMVADKLKMLSQKHQIICITHLPQIASMADAHYIIEKNAKNNRTYSNIRKMTRDESVNELARMLGGSQITDSVLANAREMKQLAESRKS